MDLLVVLKNNFGNRTYGCYAEVPIGTIRHSTLFGD